MKNFSFLFLLLVVVSAFGQDEEKAVKTTFSNYKKSILESNGEEAAKWVDSKTLNYYGKMLKTALHADSAEVAGLGVIDKLTVLIVRHKVPVSDIESMTGTQFFVYSINAGMVGKNSVQSLELGDVTTSEDLAKADVIANRQKAPIQFEFNRENGIWKMDITSIFAPTNAGLEKMIAANGLTVDQFIFQTLESLTGNPVTDKIWRPMKDKPAK